MLIFVAAVNLRNINRHGAIQINWQPWNSSRLHQVGEHMLQDLRSAHGKGRNQYIAPFVDRFVNDVRQL